MFGNKLLLARKNKGLTLEQLAEMYNKRFDGGLSKGTLSKYENGKQEPMITTVGNLASLLNVSVDYLLDDNSIDSYESDHFIELSDKPEKDLNIIYLKSGVAITREDFLKNKIKKQGYNLKDFAQMIHMPYSTLISIVNNSVGGASLDNIIKICDGLNMDIETLNPKRTIKKNNNIEIFDLLNEIDKAEIRGEIKQMLKAPKYKKAIKVKKSQPYEDGYEMVAYGADGTEGTFTMPKEETT